MNKLSKYLNENRSGGWFFDKPTKDGYYFVLNVDERRMKFERDGVPHVVEVVGGAKFVRTDYGSNMPIEEYMGYNTLQGGPRAWSGPIYPPKGVPTTNDIKEFLVKYKKINPGRYE